MGYLLYYEKRHFGEPRRGTVVVVRIGHIVRVHLDLAIIELNVRGVNEHTIAIRKLPLPARATKDLNKILHLFFTFEFYVATYKDIRL